MNKLTTQKRIKVVAALVEGASVNSAVRMTGVSKPTILKLLADLGTACAKYQDEKLRNLPCKRVQADEIWSFCFAMDMRSWHPPKKGSTYSCLRLIRCTSYSVVMSSHVLVSSHRGGYCRTLKICWSTCIDTCRSRMIQAAA